MTESWVEQCWRDILSITWDVRNVTEFNKLVLVSKPVESCGSKCCQQFILSRAQVHKRPLSVWKELLKIIGEVLSVQF